MTRPRTSWTPAASPLRSKSLRRFCQCFSPPASHAELMRRARRCIRGACVSVETHGVIDELMGRLLFRSAHHGRRQPVGPIGARSRLPGALPGVVVIACSQHSGPQGSVQYMSQPAGAENGIGEPWSGGDRLGEPSSHFQTRQRKFPARKTSRV